MGCFQLFSSADQTDYAPRPMRPSCWDIFCLWWAIGFHIFDLCTDVNVAKHYYNKGEIYYFVATIIIITIPSIVTSCVSYRMYSMDQERNLARKWIWKKKFRFVMLLLQLAPVLRYIDSLKYAYKSRKAEKQGRQDEKEQYYKKMLKEDADVALLRVFECFLESAPQQILQISYLLKSYYQEKEVDAGLTGYNPQISALSSFVGMALCLMTYQKSIRYVQEDKDNISCIGSFFIFFWHLFVAISRILMMSCMVYISGLYSLLTIVVHWIIMTISLSIIETHEFCSSASAIQFKKIHIYESLANFLFSSVLGLVYIFTYITPGEGGTFWRYTCFYTICFIENIVGAVIWYTYTATSWLTILLTAGCVVPFVMGCLCMIIYHWKFHPNQYIPPSIVPAKRQIQTPESTHLAETPSPKSSVEPEKSCNGTVASDIGQGDAPVNMLSVSSSSERL